MIGFPSLVIKFASSSSMSISNETPLDESNKLPLPLFKVIVDVVVVDVVPVVVEGIVVDIVVVVDILPHGSFSVDPYIPSGSGSRSQNVVDLTDPDHRQ